MLDDAVQVNILETTEPEPGISVVRATSENTLTVTTLSSDIPLMTPVAVDALVMVTDGCASSIEIDSVDAAEILPAASDT
ncbi:hypothetical protein [Sporosarcina sp. FSL K6-5500]|uniref:hypothetical protein n=1 Tax=Sporosarcina sp. FSL K6-5500 TaxID=2921558 RepID=UPI0030FB9115